MCIAVTKVAKRRWIKNKKKIVENDIEIWFFRNIIYLIFFNVDFFQFAMK